ncbi:ATP-binding cassette domain-containing protein [uncultured Bifidobacterium sp.]|uniref:ATP-binding cassette domain-containing protein n=1 Tax=uncultured Bifidobacterium sp. TaxID=165187 RepID=UPI0025E1BCDA|nr:ATP-binding cassette domain-containing protein [uncultured Bifidobacterium sp.]
MVEQEPCILTGTIRDNVKLGKQAATDDDIMFVLTQVGLRITGVGQEELLDRYVGESGLSLSGGQKQRIALARALIRDPKLLLMDEPTSNLDGLAEEEIAELIRNRFQDTTVVYSAHRLSLILEADWIVVIKNGVVLDKGKHSDLLDRCEYYRRLIEAQAHGKAEL